MLSIGRRRTLGGGGGRCLSTVTHLCTCLRGANAMQICLENSKTGIVDTYGKWNPPPTHLRCILMSWASEAIGSVSANVRTYVSAIHSLVKLSVCLSLSHQLHTSAFHLSCTGKAELVGGHGHRGGGWVQTWYFQPCGNLSSWLDVQTHAVAIGCGCLEPSVLLSLNFVS